MLQKLELIKDMQQTKESMDCFYSHITTAFDLAVKKCYFLRLMSNDTDIKLDIEFNRDYFTNNYVDYEFDFIIDCEYVACNYNIDRDLDNLTKQKNKEKHFDSFMELFSLEFEYILEEIPIYHRDDIETCLIFIAKWVYVNGAYQNPDEESVRWHFYEWDIELIEEEINQIAVD